MDIDLGYRKNWLNQDSILNQACINLPQATELILTIISRTKKINKQANTHFSQDCHYPNALYSYLENSMTRLSISLEVIEELIKNGCSIFGEKNILISNNHYEKCNCLDLALLSNKASLIYFFLNTDLATTKNIEHIQYLYELKGFTDFSPEKENPVIANLLNEKRVKAEKNQIENHLNKELNPTIKKIKI